MTGRHLKNDEGSALLISSVTIVILAFLASAYTLMSVSHYYNTLSRRDALQSRYVAEAGLDWALVQLNAGTLEFAGGTASAAGSITGFDFQVSAEALGGDVYRFMSTGEANGYRKTMEMVARKEIPPYLDYAIVAESSLIFRGSISVTGNIHSNEDIDMRGPATVIGDASAVGSIAEGAGGGGGVSGDIVEYSDYVVIPDISLDGFKSEAIAAGGYYDGSQTWAGPTSAITARSSARQTSTVWCKKGSGSTGTM